jgi:hypothetical protein
MAAVRQLSARSSDSPTEACRCSGDQDVGEKIGQPIGEARRRRSYGIVERDGDARCGRGIGRQRAHAVRWRGAGHAQQHDHQAKASPIHYHVIRPIPTQNGALFNLEESS